MSTSRIVDADSFEPHELHTVVLDRMWELRLIVQLELALYREGYDMISELEGIKVRLLETSTVRAYYASHEDSWFYMEREHACNTTKEISVYRLPDDRFKINVTQL